MHVQLRMRVCICTLACIYAEYVIRKAYAILSHLFMPLQVSAVSYLGRREKLQSHAFSPRKESEMPPVLHTHTQTYSYQLHLPTKNPI